GRPGSPRPQGGRHPAIGHHLRPMHRPLQRAELRLRLPPRRRPPHEGRRTAEPGTKYSFVGWGDLIIRSCSNYPTLTEVYKYATYDALGKAAALKKAGSGERATGVSGGEAFRARNARPVREESVGSDRRRQQPKKMRMLSPFSSHKPVPSSIPP